MSHKAIFYIQLQWQWCGAVFLVYHLFIISAYAMSMQW
jgi:hypothetical protein